MNSKVKAIKERLTIGQVAEILKSRGLLPGLRRVGTERLEARCPFHRDDKPSLSLYQDSGRYYCFGCGAKGDLIDLYAKITGQDNKKAIMELERIAESLRAGKMITGLSLENLRAVSSFKKAETPKPKRAKRIDSPELLNEVYSSIGEFCGWKVEPEIKNYLHRRGLKDETIERFKLFSTHGLDLRGFLLEKFSLEILKTLCLFNKTEKQTRFLFSQHRLFIPVIENGLIVALQGRYYSKGRTEPPAYIGKYNSTAFIGGKLINGDILKDLKPGTRLYLCEGAFDTMILDQLGLASIGLAGVCQWDKSLVDRIKDFDLVIAFDNDEAGEREARQVRIDFYQATGRDAKRFKFPEGVKDVNEWYLYKKGLLK